MTYFNDNSLKSQDEWGMGAYGDGTHRAISYSYDKDGKRATTTYPGALTYAYDYTGREQLQGMTFAGANVASYTYDDSGNVLTRTAGSNPASSFVYDPLDRGVGKGGSEKGSFFAC